MCTWTKQPPAPKTTSPPKAGGGGDTGWSLAGDSCKELHDLGAYCFQETRSFEQLPLSSQAECLCYMSDRTTSSWMPGLWDDAFAGCNGPKATVVITDTGKSRWLARGIFFFFFFSSPPLMPPGLICTDNAG